MNAQDELNQIESTLHHLEQERLTATRQMGTQSGQLRQLADKFEQTLQQTSEQIATQLDRLTKLADDSQKTSDDLDAGIASDQQAIDEPPDFDGQIQALQERIDDINRTTIPNHQQELQPLLTEQKDQRHQQSLLQDKMQGIVAEENRIAIKIRKAKNLEEMIALTAEQQGSIDSLRGQREDLTNQIGQIQATLHDGQAAIDAVNKKIEAARDQVKTWDTQRSQLQEAKRRRPAQVARLKQQIASLEKQKEQVNRTAQAIDDQHQQARDVQNTLSEQLATIQPLLNVLSKDVAGMETIPNIPQAAPRVSSAGSAPSAPPLHAAPLTAPTPAQQPAPQTKVRPAALVFPMLPRDPAQAAILRGVVGRLLQAGEQSVHLYTTAYEEEDSARLLQLLGNEQPQSLAWTNMYTALRQTKQPAAAPAKLNLQPDWHTQGTPDNATVEYLDGQNNLMARVQYRSNGSVRMVTYFNLPGNAQRRDFWDAAGHVAVTQSINANTGRVTNENFYRVDGSVVLIKEYDTDAEHIHVLDEQRNVIQELASDVELAAWWLSQILPADSQLITEADPMLVLNKALQARTDMTLVPILTPESTPQAWAEILGGDLAIQTAYVSDPNLLAAARTTLPETDIETL